MPVSCYEVIWIFLIYAFFGWCTEVAYAALETGNFVNRGFEWSGLSHIWVRRPAGGSIADAAEGKPFDFVFWFADFDHSY